MNRAMVDDTMYINTEEKLIAGISLLLKTPGGLKERLQKAYSDEFSYITNIPEKFSNEFQNFIRHGKFRAAHRRRDLRSYGQYF